MNLKVYLGAAALATLFFALPASAMNKCDTGVNYAKDTKFTACCLLTGKDCSTCCEIDQAHSSNCPVSYAPKKDCNAQTSAPPSDKTASGPIAPTIFYVPNALGTPYLQVIIGNFAKVLVGLSGSVALLVFVWAGITMMSANGDPKKVDTAKRMMVWTAIGLFVIFAGESLVRLVLGTLMSGSSS